MSAASGAPSSPRARSALAGQRGSRIRTLALALGLVACGRPPPPSQFPNADAALARMRGTLSCSRGVSGEAKLDYFGERGRVKGGLMYITSLPDRVRLDVVSPFGATISTLTSNGARFALFDLRQRSFLRGPANACNLQRFTNVPLPPHAFATLLRGEAPVLVHEAANTSIAWEGGQYVVTISGSNRAQQEIRLEPVPSDFLRAWPEQRVRVLRVSVRQAGVPLYRVDLTDHQLASTAPPRIDPEGFDPPVPASGPPCQAEVPRRIHFVSGDGERDLLLLSRDVAHNPPLPQGVFEQPIPAGVVVRDSECRD